MVLASAGPAKGACLAKRDCSGSKPHCLPGPVPLLAQLTRAGDRLDPVSVMRALPWLRAGNAGAAEGLDWKVGSPGGDQLCHQRAKPRSELEAVPTEAKLVIDALGRRARSDDRDVVGRACLDPGPCTHDLGTVHGGKQLPDCAGTI